MGLTTRYRMMIVEAVYKMKNVKASRSTGIVVAIMKALRACSINLMADLVSDIVCVSGMPHD